MSYSCLQVNIVLEFGHAHVNQKIMSCWGYFKGLFLIWLRWNNKHRRYKETFETGISQLT